MSLLDAIPFDGISIGSDVWRTFQMAFLAPMRTAVSDDGLIYSPVDSGLRVTQRGAGANMSVDVSEGSGWANGLAFWNTSVKNLAIGAAHATFARYDYVVVRADFITKDTRLAVKPGTPAASPVEPTLDKSAAPYYEVPLARVTVPAAATSMTNANLDDRREFINSAPAVTRGVKNVSGQTMLPGHIVAWNDWSATEVVFTTAPADPNTAGVIASVIPNNGVGLLTVQGIGLVRQKTLLGLGSRVGTSDAPGLAQENALNHIATLLESPTVVQQAARCWVDTSRLRLPTITLEKTAQESTTLSNFAYVNNMSSALSMRHGGNVLIHFRGTVAATGGGTCEFALAMDGQTKTCFRCGPATAGTTDERNFASFTHIFGDIFPGSHTAGVKWRMVGPGVGYIRGDLLPAVCQIEVL